MTAASNPWTYDPLSLSLDDFVAAFKDAQRRLAAIRTLCDEAQDAGDYVRVVSVRDLRAVLDGPA